MMSWQLRNFWQFQKWLFNFIKKFLLLFLFFCCGFFSWTKTFIIIDFKNNISTPVMSLILDSWFSIYFWNKSKVKSWQFQEQCLDRNIQQLQKWRLGISKALKSWFLTQSWSWSIFEVILDSWEKSSPFQKGCLDSQEILDVNCSWMSRHPGLLISISEGF